MNKQLILALDIGTSSVRAALYEMNGDVLPDTMVKNERALDATDDGGAELDADDGFRQVCGAIDDVLKRSDNLAADIAYVATSSFWHSLMGVDKNGDPTTKIFGWADTRSRGEIKWLRHNFNESETHNRTGARFHSSYWPAKLLWLRKTQAGAFRRTTSWMGLTDYLWLKFFGRVETSVSMASATGFFDIRECHWHEELRSYVKVKKNQLPPIADDNGTARLSAEFAARWPRLADAEWFPAVGDGAANNIGAGCVGRKKAAIMIGTSGAMRVAFRGAPPESIPSGLWCYRINHKRVIIGGALSDGGGLYGWLKGNFRLDADDDLTEDEIARRPAAGHGITFLPFVAGERSTGYHENAAGAIIGLRSSHDPVDIVHAALESVAYRFAEIFDQLKNIYLIDTVVASGGALRESPIWTQIIADVLGREMTLPGTREASSRGAVLLVLETIGKIEKLEKLETPDGQKFVPNKKDRIAYRDARSKHDKAYRLFVK